MTCLPSLAAPVLSFAGPMITAKEILMGRDVDAPLTTIQFYNLLDLLPRLNLIRFHYGKPLKVSSGYRPPKQNEKAGGAKQSCHLSLEACDFADPDGSFAAWCLANLDLLKIAGLYMEDPAHTVGWVHLQTRATKNNPFLP